MTAITAAAKRTRKGTAKQSRFLMKASTTIPKGALVAIELSSGTAVNAVDTASNPVCGVAAETMVSAASGAYWIQVEYDAIWRFTATSITQAMVGANVEVVDNNTVDETAGAGNIVAGKLVEYISTTEGWVYIPGLTT